MICPGCCNERPDDSTFCEECGAAPPSARWIWEMPDKASARKAVKVGSRLCMFVAAIDAGIGLYALNTHRTFEGYGASILVDAGLFAIVAWRLWKNSRTWAVIGVIVLVLGIVNTLREHIQFFGAGSILVFVFTLNAARGTFVLHKFNQTAEVDPETSVTPAG